MKPTAPKKLIWLLALIVGILGILSHFIKIEYVTENQFWLVVAGFGLLTLGTSFKNL